MIERDVRLWCIKDHTLKKLEKLYNVLVCDPAVNFVRSEKRS